MADEKMHITIGHLYPDLLNLYGDRGNTITLAKRCEWRGIDAHVIDLGAGQDADFEDIDLFFIGGGQDFDQRTLLADLGVGVAGSKATRLQRAIEADVPVLAICGGYQILGEYYLDHEGHMAKFIGALPMYTEAGDTRLIGNIAFRADAVEGAPVVIGFENHAGRTHLRLPIKCFRCPPGGRDPAWYGSEGLWQQRRGWHRGATLPQRYCDLQSRPASAQESANRGCAHRARVAPSLSRGKTSAA